MFWVVSGGKLTVRAGKGFPVNPPKIPPCSLNFQGRIPHCCSIPYRGVLGSTGGVASGGEGPA